MLIKACLFILVGKKHAYLSWQEKKKHACVRGKSMLLFMFADHRMRKFDMAPEHHLAANDDANDDVPECGLCGASRGQAHDPTCRVFQLDEDELGVTPLIRALHWELCRPGQFADRALHRGGTHLPACARAALVAQRVFRDQVFDAADVAQSMLSSAQVPSVDPVQAIG